MASRSPTAPRSRQSRYRAGRRRSPTRRSPSCIGAAGCGREHETRRRTTMKISENGRSAHLTAEESGAYQDKGALGDDVRKRVNVALNREAERVGWQGTVEVYSDEREVLAS